MRDITPENYTAACVELIIAFGRALTASRTDHPDQDVPIGSALELAASCGWNWETDEDYQRWSREGRPTLDEGLAESLKRALAAVKKRRDESVHAASVACTSFSEELS
jgi:hypothetical protein